MKIVIAFLFTTSLSSSTAQSYYPVTTNNISAAVTGGRFVNAFHAAYNPANISCLDKVEAALYAEKKYLTVIDVVLVAVCVPFNASNGVSVIFQHAGEADFNERIAGINYGKNFGKINAGLLFQHVSVRIRGTPNVSFLQTGMAASFNLTDDSFAAFRIMNPPLLTKTKSGRVHAASAYSLSFGWQASPDAYAGVEIRKEEGRPLSIYTTVLYQIDQKFFAMLHLNTSPSQPFAAIGWRLVHFNVLAGCSYHPVLGISPTVSFLYKKT